jgi:uncharacterized protein (TIGR03083 family)
VAVAYKAEDVLSDRCDALAAAWDVWAATLRDLPDEAWRRPTRLGDWNVAALAAHHSMFPRGLTRLVTQRADGPPTMPSAVALLRYFNQPQGLATTKSAAVAEQARTISGECPPTVLVERFAHDGPRAVAAVRAAGPIVIDYFGHATIPLTEALAVAILEATVHLLDLQRALGQEPAVPERAQAETAALLAAVADPVTVIEAASGRTTTNPFPVIR